MIGLAVLLISTVVDACHRPRRASAVRDDSVCRALIVGAFQSVGNPLASALAAKFDFHFSFPFSGCSTSLLRFRTRCPSS
jgi:hypothetical protein